MEDDKTRTGEKRKDRVLLEIITPEKVALSEEANSVIIPGVEGDFTVLPGHLALLSSIRIGVLTYTKGEETVQFAVNEGTVEVGFDKVILLTETSEMDRHIDADRAKRARERAVERLESPEAETDMGRAKRAVKRAEARLKASTRYQD
jgi:F-type H+-transporting ATPase subunit epsilon